eukprot:Skav224224  [mRNA]  locus=scaffold939:1154837:1157447:+ [translate_table: standard]
MAETESEMEQLRNELAATLQQNAEFKERCKGMQQYEIKQAEGSVEGVGHLMDMCQLFSSTDGARSDSRLAHHSVLRVDSNETAKDCPPMFPQCGHLQAICEDYSGNLLRLGVSGDESPNLLIDLTNALKGKAKVQLLVMAMFEEGGYTDENGYIAERASPEENTESGLLEVALSDDTFSVEIFKPIMNIRTSDVESQYAVKSGLGNTLIASLPRMSCQGEDRIIVAAAGLLGEGFFVVNTASLGSSFEVKKAKELPRNFDVVVDYGPMFPLLRVGYTVLLLPDQPMRPRLNDHRLLYFDTEFLNKGSHKSQPFEVRKLSETVDSKVSMIWRYNIDRLPDQTIRVYVDPSVPQRWRPFFRKLGANYERGRVVIQ